MIIKTSFEKSIVDVINTINRVTIHSAYIFYLENGSPYDVYKNN